MLTTTNTVSATMHIDVRHGTAVSEAQAEMQSHPLNKDIKQYAETTVSDLSLQKNWIGVQKTARKKIELQLAVRKTTKMVFR